MLDPDEPDPAVYIVEILPAASVVPLTTDKAGALLLLFTNAKFTVWPPEVLPEPSVTVAVRTLCPPAAKEVILAVNVSLYPGVAGFAVPVLVMTTTPVELKPPLETVALTVS
jgi:hypothetical protein